MAKHTVLLRIVLVLVLMMTIVGAGLAPASPSLTLRPLNRGGIQCEPLPDGHGCGF